MTTQHGNAGATPDRGASLNGPKNGASSPDVSSANQTPTDARSDAVGPAIPCLADGQPGAGQGKDCQNGREALIGRNRSNSARSGSAAHGVTRTLFALTPEQRDDIAALEALQAAKRRVLQSIRTLRSGSYYEDRRRRLVEQVEFFTSQLAQLDSEWENADAIMEQAQREIGVIKERLKLLRHSAAIAEIVDLTRRVNGVTE